jgi:hypothetical protein
MTSDAGNGSAPGALAARVPDFYLVGHAKCGTTALYEMLNNHPQIFMPEYKQGAGKEPWFWSRDNPNPQTDGRRDVTYTGRKSESLEQYLRLFEGARPEQRVGEASTSYLWSKSAAARIAAARPDAKIIAIIREPSSFLRSLHLQLLQNHHESVTDFKQAVELDSARLENREIPEHSYWPGALIYSDRVRYVEQLERYYAAFPKEQVLVLIYDDWRDDNVGTVQRVLRFLDVDDGIEVEAARYNPTIGLRSQRVDTLRRDLMRGDKPLLRAVRDVGKTLTTQGMRKRLYYPLITRASFGPPPPPDESFLLELRRRYKGEVVALSEYLGRDLVSLWGYDGID